MTVRFATGDERFTDLGTDVVQHPPPGEVIFVQGKQFKAYRGMGSLGAMAQAQGSKDRYFQDTTSEVEKLHKNGVRLKVVGDTRRFDANIVSAGIQARF